MNRLENEMQPRSPSSKTRNMFSRFFSQSGYLSLKNHLYNYRLRRLSVTRFMRTQQQQNILEVGCGLSPVTNSPQHTIFTDLSFEALAALKATTGAGEFIMADCCHLPFKPGVFSHTISSEMLEHIPDDRSALVELARVTHHSGRLIITFPHRRCYFSKDDDYVKHFRRYELRQMQSLFKSVGFGVEKVEKILGPIEKPLMLAAVFLYELFLKKGHLNAQKAVASQQIPGNLIFRLLNSFLIGPVWLEARLLPVSMATVLMIIGRHEE